MTSISDGRLQFAISATGLDDVTYAIHFLVCVTDNTFCLDFLVNLCLIDLAQGPKGWSFQLEIHSQQLCQYVCAPSDDWTSLELSLYSDIILTGCVSIDAEEIIHFVGSCLLSVVSSSRTITPKQTFEHPQCGSGVGYWRSCHERGLVEKKYCLPMSDNEEDSIDVNSFSNFSSADSSGGAYRAEATNRWTTSKGITAKFYHSLTGQLRGSSMRFEVQVIYKLKYQKELMVKPEMCWNNVWQPAERQQDFKQKGDPVHEKKSLS